MATDASAVELPIVRRANGHTLVVVPRTNGSVGFDFSRVEAMLDANVAMAVRWNTVDYDALPAWEPDPDEEDSFFAGSGTYRLLRWASDRDHHRAALSTLQRRHEVELPAFAIDRTRITCAQYAAFVAATGSAAPSAWRGGSMPEGRGACPVSGVSYEDATRYAAWVGLSLPSEVEWEIAGGGGDGRRYPWGDVQALALDAIRGGAAHARPADAFAELASPFGVLGMMGSSWEWCEDLYWTQALPKSTSGLLLGVSPTWRALRGGTRDDLPYALFSRFGADPAARYWSHGFRCVLRDLGSVRTERLVVPARADPSVALLPEPAPTPALRSPVPLDLDPELVRSWKDGLRDLRLARSPLLPVTRAHGTSTDPPCVERRFGSQRWHVGSGIPPAQHPRVLHGGFNADEILRARCGDCASADVLVVAFQAGASMGGDFYYDLEVRCPRCGAYTGVAYADSG